MAKSLHTSQRSIPSCHSLLLVLLITLVGLLAGCGASTSHPFRPTLIPTKELKGTITEFSLSASSSISGYPGAIAAGPDGNLWFTEELAGKIGRITPGGTFTEFPIQTAPGQGPVVIVPIAITAGPDGNLWFVEGGNNKIGRITPSGTITEFPLTSQVAIAPGQFVRSPGGITAGPDGNLWFTEELADKIGRITPSGTITEYPLPASQGDPRAITTGPDGNLWFTEGLGNKIGRIT